MPPVFKKPKEYDPELARKTMQLTGTLPISSELDEDRRQMLVDLGLADDDDDLTPVASDEDEETKEAFAQDAKGKQAVEAENGSSGSIGAFYPDGFSQTGSSRYMQELQARTAQAVQQLQGLFGRADLVAADTLQTLLLDLQRQVEVQQRGQDSMRNSMGALRRRTKEAEERQQQLEAEQEEQQQAIRRVDSMNGKLQAALGAAASAKLQLAELSAQLQAKTNELAQSKKEVQQLHAEATSAAAVLNTERATSASLQQALTAAQGSQQLSQAASEVELQQQLQQTQQQLRHSEQQLRHSEQQLQQSEQQLQQSQQQVEQQQGHLKSAQEQVQHLQQQLSTSQTELSSTQQQLQAARTSSQSSTEQSNAQSQQLAALMASEQRLQQRVAELERSLAANKKEAEREAATAMQRCADLDIELTQLRVAAQNVNMNQSELQQQCAAEAEAHRSAQAQLATLTKDREGLREALAEEVKRGASQQGLAAEQLQALAAKQAEANAQLLALRAERDGLQERLVAANTEAAKNARKAADELAALRTTAAVAQQELAQVQSKYEQRVAALQQEAALQVQQYKQQWRTEFDKRRKLHNQVIELKGNIRVLARIRPLLGKELANEAAATGSQGSTVPPVDARNEETIVLNAPTGSKEFEFDRVFQQQEGQEQVFDEVAPLVTSVLDGYNVCIIAYGQTGSGKTHTMEGPQDNPGVNTRALRELFMAAEERSSEMVFNFSASVLEIYQEQIFDLLSGSRDTGDKLDVKEGPTGMHVPGLRQEAVASLEEVARVLQKGKQNRTTFATNMNEHSSRSHLVVSLHVRAQDLKSGACCHAKLHLIDLAGSERLSRSGAQGERLKEAQAINKSLSALGDVISALQQRSAHVPYRNSKLTRLLEDSLGGNSKCVMFVNCSPAAENVGETKCSLEFASRARKVELGAAKRNLDTSSASNSTTQREGRDIAGAGCASSRDLGASGRDNSGPGSTMGSSRTAAVPVPAPPPGGPGSSSVRPRPPAAAAPGGAAAGFRRPMPGMQ